MNITQAENDNNLNKLLHFIAIAHTGDFPSTFTRLVVYELLSDVMLILLSLVAS